MAHHAPDPADETGGLLPRSNLWRVVVALVAAALLAATTLTLWATGGLARADTSPDQRPGTQVRTGMYTMTPHKAEFVTEDGTTALEVRADIISNDTEPVPVSSVDQGIEVSFPSNKLESGVLDVVYTRHPDGLVFDLQPDMREEIRMLFSLRKADGGDGQQDGEEDSDNPLAGLGGGDPEDGSDFDMEELLEQPGVAPLAAKQDEVTLSFSEMEFTPGFTDQSEAWRTGDETAAEITFPLGQE